ncbi:DUF2333 family protein [Kordiimonas marina]|uniref:DUF2333 family protein n=1 Tax=Kordiimonas marina TaxID=2872312 RepID=UPI001FF2CCA2|nr:DUF2333 family protein [Kordiimonas marina]MCJ9429907.1 DUF2333 family protein [Kordiimonas marina]
MAAEIWLWIREQVARLFGSIGRLFVKLWRWFTGWLGSISGSTWRRVVLAVPALFALYILIGMPLTNRIDDTLPLDVQTPSGGSRTVADLSYLVKRETLYHAWVANDPAFMPGWWIDNTPNFQRGMIGALSRFAFELRDQIGRSRGSSSVDKDLESAAGNLAKEPDRWLIDFSTSMMPTRTSDSYYREAARSLDAYNARLAKGDAVFERRSDNLLATIDRIALDLGASSAAIERYIGEHAGGVLPDFGADDLFYQVKGQVYAYTVILTALREDFASVIKDKELSSIYDELLRSLSAAARLEPLVVTNGARDGVLANHLSMQGFYLLRARTQLREVSSILAK